LKKKLKILVLDIEGGHGGSSKSIYYSIKNSDSDLVDVEVWFKKAGQAEVWYRSINKKFSIQKNMTRINSYSKIHINIFEMIKYFFNFYQSSGFRKKLISESKKFDVIHLNHYSLAHLAFKIKPKINIPIVMHSRVMLYDNFFSRWQCKLISKSVDRLVFISENEKENFKKIGCTVDGDIIYNISAIPKEKIKLDESLILENKFKVACLANFAYVRGVDRLVDIAKFFKKNNIENIVFVVVGDNKISRNFSLKDLASQHKVEKYFIFKGYSVNPENILASCNALIRPSRENNPWGRDILEAMALELPVISFGRYNTFVENNITGFLHKEFNISETAENLIQLSKNPHLCAQLGKEGKKRIQTLCDGKKQSARLVEVWQNIAEYK